MGIGKTLAYLTAAVLVKRGRANDFWLRGSFPGQSWADSAHLPVVVSTSSIALQNAIVRDYIPALSRVLMDGGVIREPLTCALRKGREHYLCERRLCSNLADADEATTAILAPLLAHTESIDLAGVQGLTPYMKRRIGVQSRCARHCPYRETCRYQRHMERARSNRHDFQICNHNYLLADILRRRDGETPLIPHYQAVIIDEGHKFLDAARQMCGVELASSDIPPIAADIHTLDFCMDDNASKIWRDAKKLAGQSKRLFNALEAGIAAVDADEEADRFPAVFNEDSTRNLRNIRRISGDLLNGLEDQRVPTRHQGKCANVQWELAKLEKNATTLREHDDLICWMEHRGKELTLRGIPKNLDELLFRDFWSKNIPIVLTSGTLSAAGDFTRIKQSLGLRHIPMPRVTETRKPSPFDYYNNTLLYISDRVPFPDIADQVYLTAVADEVEHLVRTSNGHAAVLFTSYKAMDMIREMLEARHLPFPLFQLNRGKVDAIQKFKQSGRGPSGSNGVLLASGAMWEGIDIPGDALSMLIIVKLPFPVPDPINEYERSLCGDMGVYKNRIIIPDMQVRLRQGAGRGPRTETDSCVIALLDYRAQEGKPYRDVVLNTLPTCPVTSEISVAGTFLHKKKPSAFFE